MANLAKVHLSFIFLNASLKSAWQPQDERDKWHQLKEGQPCQPTPPRRGQLRLSMESLPKLAEPK
jgi:hypothetical protein